MISPDRKYFKELSRQHNVIPVWTELMVDMETPISVFKKIQRKHDVNFLLESIEGGELLARYSFLGFNPLGIIEAKNGTAKYEKGGRTDSMAFNDPLDYLKTIVNAYNYPQLSDMPPMTGGIVGYLSYDCIRYFDPVKISKPDELDMPELLFFVAGNIVVFDHQRHSLKIIVNIYLEGDIDMDKAYEGAVDRLKELTKLISEPLDFVAGNGEKTAITGIRSSISKEGFMGLVDKAKEYILNGDIFQVVLSQRFEADLNVEPFDVYRALRRINPSPYMYYLKYKDIAIAGSSPEPLVKVDGKKVITRPIAGTRKRGTTDIEDIRLEKELLSDKKEIAEHVMLVDLGRNDLGRVCKPGTVYPDKFMSIERFSHVMHIVTNLEGELEEGKDAFDALRAVFPAGTVSGAPKIRAMQIIDDLENIRRGPYAGIVGYFSFTGNLDSCITIRTVIIKDGKAYIQAGAGIVADSVPENEYKETENKAMALIKAIRESAALQ